MRTNELKDVALWGRTLGLSLKNKIGLQSFVNVHTYLGLRIDSDSDIAPHICY